MKSLRSISLGLAIGGRGEPGVQGILLEELASSSLSLSYTHTQSRPRADRNCWVDLTVDKAIPPGSPAQEEVIIWGGEPGLEAPKRGWAIDTRDFYPCPPTERWHPDKDTSKAVSFSLKKMFFFKSQDGSLLIKV